MKTGLNKKETQEENHQTLQIKTWHLEHEAQNIGSNRLQHLHFPSTANAAHKTNHLRSTI